MTPALPARNASNEADITKGHSRPRNEVASADMARAFRERLTDHQRARPVPTLPTAREPLPRLTMTRDDGKRMPLSLRDEQPTMRDGDATLSAAPLPVPIMQIEAAGVALGPDPAAAAAIGRMAAAIAAALSRNEQPVFAISFNGASVIAEGALITREPGGALGIRLDGVAPVAVLPAAALEGELRVALERRRVRMGRLEWGAPAGLNDLRKASKRFAESGARHDAA